MSLGKLSKVIRHPSPRSTCLFIVRKFSKNGMVGGLDYHQQLLTCPILLCI